MAVESSALHGIARVSAPLASVRVATWNIHGAIGADRRYAPARIAAVLAELDADIVALQEVAPSSTHERFLAGLAHETGYHAVDGPLDTPRRRGSGNAVLSRHVILRISHHDLTIDGLEPRGALDVCVDVGGRSLLRVVATHLGLRPGERREQVRRLLAAVELDPPLPTLLMGDLNEWYLWGRPLRWLHAHFRERPTAPPTFPARRPVFALDRIWVAPTGTLRRLQRHASPLARIASDHLPLVAEIAL